MVRQRPFSEDVRLYAEINEWYVEVCIDARKNNKDFKGAIQNENLEQLLFYFSPYEAPTKPLISTYQVINH